MREYGKQIEFMAPATSRDTWIYKLENSDKWIYLDVRGDDAVETEIDLMELMDGLATVEVKWNYNDDKLLVKAKDWEEIKLLLVYPKNVKASFNLSNEFAMNFSEVRFATDGGERLIALENGNLRTIVPGDRTVSQVLASKVKDFAS